MVALAQMELVFEEGVAKLHENSNIQNSPHDDFDWDIGADTVFGEKPLNKSNTVISLEQAYLFV